MRRSARGLVAAVLALMAVASLAETAEANTVIRDSVDTTFVVTMSNLCSFPVVGTGHETGTRTRFFDNSGVKFMAIFQLTEQDVFSANGVSLTGNPYSFMLERDFTNGVLTSQVATGVAEKLVLPNGSLFISAGYIDFLAQGVPASITPDHGVTGDIGALCTALSP